MSLTDHEPAAPTIRSLTRRAFLATVSTVAWTPAFDALSIAAATHGARAYAFFRTDEARFIEAACDRLIPADAHGSGALDAQVPLYLDRQLAGPWGAGRWLYRMGSWQPGTSRLPSAWTNTPAQYIRAVLTAINAQFAAQGAAFAELTPASQSFYLRALQSGEIALPITRSSAFFDLLLIMIAEGFFTHPIHGGTRDRLSWRLSGFPGAHAIAS